MHYATLKKLGKKTVATLLAFAVLGSTFMTTSFAANLLTNVADALDTVKVSSTASHTISFTPATTNIKHIKFEFHTTNAVDYNPASTVNPPDVSGATFNFGSSSLWTDGGGIEGNISTIIGSNSITLSRTDGGAYAIPVLLRTAVLENIVNSDTAGTVYMTISTYQNDTQLAGGLDQAVEKGTTAMTFTDGIPVAGFKGTSFFFGIDDSDTTIPSNSSDQATDSDSDERAKVQFGTIVEGVLPTEHPTTGAGVDGQKLSVSTNSTNGYVITLRDDAKGFALTGAQASDRANTDTDNGVLNDFGEEDVSGGTAGISQANFETAVLAGDEVFTFMVDSGPHASLTLDTYYSLKTTNTSEAEIAEYQNLTSGTDEYIVKFYATKHADTPGGSFTNTLTYTALPAL